MCVVVGRRVSGLDVTHQLKRVLAALLERVVQAVLERDVWTKNVEDVGLPDR